MSEIYDGAVEVSIGYDQLDLDEMKDQVSDLLDENVNLEKLANLLRSLFLEGLSSAAIWLSFKAARDAPWLTRRLQKSGSVWVENKRISITGDGTHPDQLDTGPLTAIIIFNTPYAFLQDSEPGYRHPRGGRSGYLTGNLEENHKIIQEMMFAPLLREFNVENK